LRVEDPRSKIFIASSRITREVRRRKKKVGCLREEGTLKMKRSKRNLALTQPKAKQIASKKCDA